MGRRQDIWVRIDVVLERLSEAIARRDTRAVGVAMRDIENLTRRAAAYDRALTSGVTE